MPTRIPAPLQDFDPKRIGRYQILGRIGAGAMGQVYLARSPGSRLVAVKTIRADLAADGDFRRRFAHEVTAARRVGGAFTAPVVDADPHADLPWLATVYLAVPSLSALVKQCGPLPVPAVRWLAAGCAEALENIHRAGLVHRDLKPGNVLVAPDGPRVIDFGLVRADGLSHLTNVGDAMGTPSFMSPEQASGKGRVGPAADVFSLGATLVYAATGNSPYKGENGAQVIFQMMTGKPDLSDVPEGLRGIIAACLSPDPAERPTPAALMEYHAPYMTGSNMAPPLPSSALRMIAEYGRRLTEELGRRSDDDVEVDGPLEQWEIDLDRFLGQDPAHPSLIPVPKTTDDRTKVGPSISRHSRKSWVLASVAVAVTAGIAGGVGYGLHRESTTRITTAASTAGTARVSPAAQAALGAGSPQAGSGASGTPIGGGELGGYPGGPGGPGGPPPGMNGPPPGYLPPPPSQAIWQANGLVLTVSPPYGDQFTGFILHGTGWPPGIPVTLKLVGGKTVTDGPVPDSTGGFDYLMNTNHQFFSGTIPPGTYQIEAITGSVVATVTFSVSDATGTAAS